MNEREPIFAKQGWYPADPQACQQTMEEYLASYAGQPTGRFAGIVPHAGWIFSGQLAAWTFASLAKADPQVVFLFGGHMGPADRCSGMPTGAYGTPVGPVLVQTELAALALEQFGCAREGNLDFEPDNTIELQMPFIRYVWPQARVVAIRVPPGEVAEAMGAWAAQVAKEKKLRAVAIGSTDLTHYGPGYGFTPQGLGEEALTWSKQENDRPFIEHLMKLRTEQATRHALRNHSACCPGAAVAAVAFARAQGVTEGKLIRHTTSHEVEGRGRPSMWVGYAAVTY